MLDREMKSTRLSETFSDFQRLSETFETFSDFQRLSETFIDFQGIHEVLDAKDEYLMLSVKYLNKGRNNKNNFQTCRTVRDTLSRSKIINSYIYNTYNTY